jgi:RNA polymerase sigma factor (TIGR02999 family)
MAKTPIPDWRDRAQFFAFAATVMRRLMVDYWRARQAAKRGGVSERILFDELIHTPSGGQVDMEALDEALTRLSALDEKQARIVELRFFGGMSAAETAAHLGISERTVHREWGMAKAWLSSQLEPGK